MAQHDYHQHQYPPPTHPHHQYPYQPPQPPPQPPQQYLPQPYPPPSHLPPPPPQYDYPNPNPNPNPNYPYPTYDYPYPNPHHTPPPQYPPPSYPTHHYAPDPYDPYPRPHHHHQRRNSHKRSREPLRDIGTETTPTTKKQAVGNDVLFRVVVPSEQIGKVIGKAGHRVRNVRELTKATIKIADPIARFEERIIIISSKEKTDGGVTDAEKALLQIASLILLDDGGTAQTVSDAASTDPYAAASVMGAGHVAPNSIKLLIAGSQASGLIGVSGQNIDKLRNSSGAAIAVLAPSELPMCASAHESDRLVQISGESSAVLKAVEEIGVELRANPPKQVISISPTYNLSISRAAQSHMDPNAAECVTLDMVISETMVGGLIGRAGSNIGQIRAESGAMIKVFGGKGQQKHRQIQLIGTAEQVALAKQRVDEFVYTQLTQSGDD